MTNRDTGPEYIAVVEAIDAAVAASDLSTCSTRRSSSSGRLAPWGRRHVGHDDFAKFGPILRASIASWVTTDAMFSADRDVVHLGHTCGTVVATGFPFDIAEVDDGRPVAPHFSVDTPAMLRALTAR